MLVARRPQPAAGQQAQRQRGRRAAAGSAGQAPARRARRHRRPRPAALHYARFHAAQRFREYTYDNGTVCDQRRYSFYHFMKSRFVESQITTCLFFVQFIISARDYCFTKNRNLL